MLKKWNRWTLPLILLAVLAGCYHATVDTGAAPSFRTIDLDWAHSFLGGLVPPGTVEAASKCPNGVARVETKLSFLNMVATGLTGGLYSPMNIKVTCAAASGTAAALPIAASPAEAEAMLRSKDAFLVVLKERGDDVVGDAMRFTTDGRSKPAYRIRR